MPEETQWASTLPFPPNICFTCQTEQTVGSRSSSGFYATVMFGCVVSAQSLDPFSPPHVAFDLTGEWGDSIVNLENIDVDFLNLSGLFALMFSSGHQAHGSRDSKHTPAQSVFCEGCSFDSSSFIKGSRRLKALSLCSFHYAPNGLFKSSLPEVWIHVGYDYSVWHLKSDGVVTLNIQ